MSKAPSNDRNINRLGLWTRVIGVMAVGAVLILTPGIAQASFVSGTQSHMGTSTLTLTAPAKTGTSVDASCSHSRSGYVLSIQINSLAAVPGANAYQLTVRSPAGAESKADVGTKNGTVYQWSSTGSGTWTYEIRGQYKVPGTSNVWTGLPLTDYVTCH